MKKLVLVASLVVTGFFGFMASDNQNEYKVTGEIREFLICENSENEGFFIEKNEATSNLEKGDTVEIISNENNEILSVVKK